MRWFSKIKAPIKCAPGTEKILYLTYVIVIVVGSLSTLLWYSLSRGQDFNWDQLNYHIGVPFLLSHGTFWTSIAPAGLQSYYNPAFLSVQFIAKQHLGGVLFQLLIGAIQSLTFIIAGFICLSLTRTIIVPRNLVEPVLLALLGFGLCLIAPMPLSEAGTTFPDLAMAVPVVGAYALLLWRENSQVTPAAAGMLIGAATALKLTNGVFGIAALAFALAGAECWRRRLRWLTFYCTSALSFFLVVGGAWHMGLWNRFHNPFFPYYNNIFFSPDFPAIASRDPRFLPKSVLDFWRYPLYWLVGGSPNEATQSPSAELAFTDARWIIVVVGATIFLAALALLPEWRQRKLKDPATGFFFAFLLAYAVWLGEFGVQRYLVPIDVLCGAVVLFLFLQLPWPRTRLLLLATVAALAWVMLVVPDWGHISFGQNWRAINAARLFTDEPSIVFLTDKPSLYVAASLPSEWRYVGLNGEFGLDPKFAESTLVRQLKEELTTKPKLPLKALDRGSLPEEAAATLARYGLVPTTKCESLQVATQFFRLCDVERLGK
jgi:hypothetical protein